MIQPLTHRWFLRPASPSVSVPSSIHDALIHATVPGCVHTDLIRHGLIGDPDHGFVEEEIAWIGESDWAYACTFVPDEGLFNHERIDLVFDGLDTIATVELNGQTLGSAHNMHHPHRFDVGSRLKQGENQLVVTFRSPIRFIESEEKRLGSRPVNGDWAPYPFIRKMACNFRWDWGPAVATAGIWRPAYLEGWSGVRLDHVVPMIHREEARTWVVDIRAMLVWTDHGQADAVRLAASLSGKRGVSVNQHLLIEPGLEKALLRLIVADPALWWPAGHGKPTRYPLEVKLEPESGTRVVGSDVTLDSYQTRIGFRTVALDTTPDEIGSAFTLVVNDQPIFCKGANWIPDDLFPSRMTQERYRERLVQARDANMNMVRVWGGGIYEDACFYETCDALGLMVWQDFMFACATYPEEEPLRSSVEREARHNVARLASHPSVVLWCGGNECVWAHHGWGFGERLREGQSWGHAYYHEMLPQVVDELDPTRPYWVNSPYSGDNVVDPQDEVHGNFHLWDGMIEAYRTRVPRFVSEFGHQGPPQHATLAGVLKPEHLAVDSRAMHHRQRATGGNEKWYSNPMAEWFAGAAGSFAQWHYRAQLLQARAVSLGIAWMRAHRPQCMGSLFWQLNDCWAGHSWSAVDSAGRRKPLWYAARRAFAPRMATVQPIDGEASLVLCNDEDRPWEARAVLRRMRFDGHELARDERVISVAPASVSSPLPLDASLGQPADPGSELIVADVDGANRACWFFARDKDLAYPSPQYRIDKRERAFVLTAETLLRDIVLAVDHVNPDSECDEQLVTLLPGEQWVVNVTASRHLAAEDLSASPVFNCAR